VIEYVAKKFENTSLIIVGHSMGGSIATKTLCHMYEKRADYKACSQIKGNRTESE